MKEERNTDNGDKREEKNMIRGRDKDEEDKKEERNMNNGDKGKREI